MVKFLDKICALNTLFPFENGKTKFRTQHRFKGQRKRRVKANKITQEQIDQLVQPQAEEVRPEVNKEGGGSSTKPSSSRVKMDLLGVSFEDINKDFEANPKDKEDENTFFLIQLSAMKKLIGLTVCPLCNQNGLSFEMGKDTWGFCLKGKLTCTMCDDVIGDEFLSDRVGNTTSPNVPFEVNMRAVVAFRGIGCGHSAMKEWSSMLNMPSCLSNQAYRNLAQKLHAGARQTHEQVRDKTCEAIRKSYAEIGVKPDENGILDIGVSYDGTWQKRGHSSHNGIGSVIDLLTGLPIDYEVLSNICKTCNNAPDASDPNYEQWQMNHKAQCNKNYQGSSNSMEAECAKRIWARSVELVGLRYTIMLCDGDSKSFNNVSASKVYGNNVEMKKEDCVNHVAKRMGTALRNLKAEAKAQKQPISGKGKLTEDMMTKIQNYYGRAIKDNANDIPVMKKRIFAILFHLISTDEHPEHVHCPPGVSSWCFWQRAIAKDEAPGKHNEHSMLPKDIGMKLVPIFQRLTERGLLERCQKNRTQNPNESLHNVIWRFCPKITYVGRKVVETATCLAICQFGMGSSLKLLLHGILEMEPGVNLEASVKQSSIERIKIADRANSEEKKKRRRQLRFKKSSQQKKVKEKEGETYKAGAFS